jgi:hypothetical protein
MRSCQRSRIYCLQICLQRFHAGGVNNTRTFFTNPLTNSFLTTSSASFHSPRTSYVLRHSVKSAVNFNFTFSLSEVVVAVFAGVLVAVVVGCLPFGKLSLETEVEVRARSVDANRWSRSEESVDWIRSIRYALLCTSQYKMMRSENSNTPIESRQCRRTKKHALLRRDRAAAYTL